MRGTDSKAGDRSSQKSIVCYPLLEKSGVYGRGQTVGRPGLSEDPHARTKQGMAFVGGSCDRGSI